MYIVVLVYVNVKYILIVCDVHVVTGATRSVNGSDLTLSTLELKPDNISLLARFSQTYHP